MLALLLLLCAQFKEVRDIVKELFPIVYTRHHERKVRLSTTPCHSVTRAS
jgi:hypothetical protein